MSALRSIPDEDRGWQTERRSVQCQSCKAVMVYDPARVGQNCEFCGSPALVDYQEIKSPIRPQSLLPFKVTAAQIRERMRAWYAGRWFAPGKLKRIALVDQIKGIYIPYWTFDAQAECPWRAEAGYYYYVTESYTDNQGKRQTRQVRKVRWEPASGHVSHFFDDEPVPGSRGIDAGLLRGIEPFPTKELVPYDTAFLSGFVVEHYQVVLLDAAKQGARADARGAPGAVLGAGPGRHAAEPRDLPDLLGRDVQAHPGAAVAADLHLRDAGLPGGGQRLHRHDRRQVSEEPVEDRRGRAACHSCYHHVRRSGAKTVGAIP